MERPEAGDVECEGREREENEGETKTRAKIMGDVEVVAVGARGTTRAWQ